jgi:hypothetical protein
MQVMPAAARMLGFTGTEVQLADPEINIHYGAKYLAGAWRLAGEDLCTATMKYRAGRGETRFSFLSVDYCMRVRNHLAARGVAVSGAVPQPTFGRSSFGRPSGAHTRSRQLSVGSTVNLAALNMRRARRRSERLCASPADVRKARAGSRSDNHERNVLLVLRRRWPIPLGWSPTSPRPIARQHLTASRNALSCAGLLARHSVN